MNKLLDVFDHVTRNAVSKHNTHEKMVHKMDDEMEKEKKECFEILWNLR